MPEDGDYAEKILQVDQVIAYPGLSVLGDLSLFYGV